MKIRALIATIGILGTNAIEIPPAAAQQNDVNRRVAAMQACSADPYNLGYGSYDICVNEIYQEIVSGSTSGGSPASWRESATDPFDIFDSCAASRIPEGCH